MSYTATEGQSWKNSGIKEQNYQKMWSGHNGQKSLSDKGKDKMKYGNQLGFWT